MTYHNKKRRTFLRYLFNACAVVAGGYILWVIKNFILFSQDSQAASVGTYIQLLKSSVTHREKERFFLVRDDRGLYALSDTCTHRGCMLRYEHDQFICPCHGAVFTLTGKPVSGPAEKNLDYYYIYKDNQNMLSVNTARTVSEDFRYAE